MTSDIQHNQNEIISKHSYHICIYALQVVRLQDYWRQLYKRRLLITKPLIC